MGLAIGDLGEDAVEVVAGEGPLERPCDLAVVLACLAVLFFVPAYYVTHPSNRPLYAAYRALLPYATVVRAQNLRTVVGNRTRRSVMGIGTSIVLIAVGAIIRFAVNISWQSATVNWNLIGDILMVVGIVGLVISLIWMATASRRDVVVGSRVDDPRLP